MKQKIFKPNILGRLKLTIHCLLNLHLECHREDNGIVSWIACFDCNGRPKFEDKFWKSIDK